MLGAATSPFVRQASGGLYALTSRAILDAITAAGVEPGEIEAVYVGNVFGPSGVVPRVLRDAGITGVPSLRLEAACASGTLAAHQAVRDVVAGRHRTVLALGVEMMSELFDGPIVPERTDPEGSLGLPLPGLYALQAHRYLSVHGLDVADIARVAVKNRAQGALNPAAQKRTPVTLEQVLGSRPIAEPLTLDQCCPVGDGAAAAVIGLSRRADDVLVTGTGWSSGLAWPGVDDLPWGMASVTRAAEEAFAASRRSAPEVDVLEVHDAFTIGEVLTVEALGLCAPGTAPRLLADGELGPGGRWPVNTSGGLLSRGHALGATGVAQIAEVYEQLTGRSGERQVAAPRIGLVETMGGGASGLDGNTAVVMVLEAQQ
ncbi:thiolase family protein [Nocardioides humi]|uniref:Thiolase family protein n=1 Tax=Nocardioides humi TaxID=449461 RepID=A0ABN2A7M0_9ACTN